MFVFRTSHFNRFIFTLIFWNTHATLNLNSKFPTAINILTAINLFIVCQKPTFISCISIITNTFVLLYTARSIALLGSQQNGSWNGPRAMVEPLAFVDISPGLVSSLLVLHIQHTFWPLGTYLQCRSHISSNAHSLDIYFFL